jgi:hypothetical protein
VKNKFALASVPRAIKNITTSSICLMLALQCVLAFFAYAEPKPAVKPDAVKERKDLAEASIGVMNKKLDCDGDGECDVLEMGSRLCGGPSRYLVISNNNTNLKTMKQKIEEFTTAEKELNLIGASGDCAPSPTLPQARCVKNQCVESKR